LGANSGVHAVIYKAGNVVFRCMVAPKTLRLAAEAGEIEAIHPLLPEMTPVGSPAGNPAASKLAGLLLALIVY